jgi:hypothetical protein
MASACNWAQSSRAYKGGERLQARYCCTALWLAKTREGEEGRKAAQERGREEVAGKAERRPSLEWPHPATALARSSQQPVALSPALPSPPPSAHTDQTALRSLSLWRGHLPASLARSPARPLADLPALRARAPSTWRSPPRGGGTARTPAASPGHPCRVPPAWTGRAGRGGAGTREGRAGELAPDSQRAGGGGRERRQKGGRAKPDAGRRGPGRAKRGGPGQLGQGGSGGVWGPVQCGSQEQAFLAAHKRCSRPEGQGEESCGTRSV